MTVITRFAPSPTGLLHVGNVRTALVCWLYANKHQGQFLLRLDDTDRERSTAAFAEAIKEDLSWLGLNWDDCFNQSDRLDKYTEQKQKLIEAGRLYPCFESEEELNVKRKMQLSRGLPPIYDRASLALTKEQIEANLSEKKAVHWRFKLAETPIRWTDLVRGDMHFESKHLSDPILIRTDGTPTYMLPSTVDDIDKKITHVVRGEDHISNTAIQIQLFEAMGASPPEFAHLSLIKSKAGDISKRIGGFDIQAIRKAGIEPIAILSLFAKIGTSDPIEASPNVEQLLTSFSLDKYSKAPAHYDLDELLTLNAKYLHHLEYKNAKPRLASLGLQHIDEQFYNITHTNLNILSDIAHWWNICHDVTTPVIVDTKFSATALALLPPEPWDESSWDTWTSAIKQETGRKGKELFMPLRLALTGLDHGPELKQLLPLIGREKSQARLQGNTA